jgi:hypothetical protein
MSFLDLTQTCGIKGFNYAKAQAGQSRSLGHRAGLHEPELRLALNCPIHSLTLNPSPIQWARAISPARRRDYFVGRFSALTRSGYVGLIDLIPLGFSGYLNLRQKNPCSSVIISILSF